MAKDPAFNWYFDNWDGGTKLFTRHQKGCYMDLLSAQFHCGHLTLENIKTVLGSDFGEWEKALKPKFEIDENGTFFNERLEHEILKKRKFIDKQHTNGIKGGRPSKKPKENPNDNPNQNPKQSLYGIGIENETVFEKEKGVQGEKQGFKTMPKPEDVGELPDVKIQKAIEALKIQTDQTVDAQTVVEMWGVFKVQFLTGTNFYPDVGKVESHFLNWILKKKFERNGVGKTRQERTTSSLERLAQRGSQAIDRIRAKDS